MRTETISERMLRGTPCSGSSAGTDGSWPDQQGGVVLASPSAGKAFSEPLAPSLADSTLNLPATTRVLMCGRAARPHSSGRTVR
jgi:hypothetical protein